jgi:hypothetical protein
MKPIIKPKRVRPYAVQVYLPRRHVPALKAAAAAADVSLSKFCARAALDSVEASTVTNRLLTAPAFRDALVAAINGPAFIGHLTERLNLSTPGQLELFKRDVTAAVGLIGTIARKGKG